MNPDNLTHQSALSILERYPACTYAALVALRTSDNPAERDRLRLRISASVGDYSALRELLGADSESLTDFYPDSLPPKLSTDDTISSFIDKFGGNMQPLPDSVAITPVAVAQPAGAADDKIDNTPCISNDIDKADTETDTKIDDIDNRVSDASCDTQLSESFARILIKNGNYTKALEIITELNLKNPEKSIYFADQIRFLKKLIVIQNAGK